MNCNRAFIIDKKTYIMYTLVHSTTHFPHGVPCCDFVQLLHHVFTGLIRLMHVVCTCVVCIKIIFLLARKWGFSQQAQPWTKESLDAYEV